LVQGEQLKKEKDPGEKVKKRMTEKEETERERGETKGRDGHGGAKVEKVKADERRGKGGT